MESTIMRGAEPYFHRGSKIGCLCLHGFTASPHEMLWMGKHFASQNYTVYVPRLAGHGTHPHDLARTTWHDWFNSALDGYHLLRQQCDQVFVCGLSMGGLLALRIGMTEQVDGLVVMASPLTQRYPLNPVMLSSLKYVRPFTDQSDSSPFADYICSEQTRRGEPVLGRVRYGIWSTAAVEQLARLIGEVSMNLHHVTASLLGMYSEGDATVKLDSFERLKTGIRSVDREFHVFERSGHILTQDVDCEDVFQKAASFIAHRVTTRESGIPSRIETGG